MEFNQKVRDFVKQCEAKLPHINSEEGTKVALVLPFLRTLGYDTTDPCEVSLEFTADVGIKKGEKVDIVVSVNSQPTFLIEVKPYGSDLSVHDTQLFRYFTATNANFAILTDGITYKFFSDLESTNKLDRQPFLEVNLLEADDAQLARLQQVFDKKTLDLTELPSVARDLKFTNKIKEKAKEEFRNPGDEFVRFWLKDAWSGRLTQKIVDEMRPVVRAALNQYVNEMINDRLRSAMEQGDDTQPEEKDEKEPVVSGSKDSKVLNDEEFEGYYIIKSIVRRDVDPNRLTYEKTTSGISVRLDNKLRQWLCRLRMGKLKKCVDVNDEGDTREISNINDLFELEDRLRDAVRKFAK